MGKSKQQTENINVKSGLPLLKVDLDVVIKDSIAVIKMK